MKMVTDQVRSLYAGLYRTIFLLGLLIAAAWLFTLFSYYLSEKTGTDWFRRSGSVMGLIGAAVAFRQVNFYQSALATALKEGLVSVPREIELGLKPPTPYRVLSYLGYVTGIVGTVASGTYCSHWFPEFKRFGKTTNPTAYPSYRDASTTVGYV